MVTVENVAAGLMRVLEGLAACAKPDVKISWLSHWRLCDCDACEETAMRIGGADAATTLNVAPEVGWNMAHVL